MSVMPCLLLLFTIRMNVISAISQIIHMSEYCSYNSREKKIKGNYYNSTLTSVKLQSIGSLRPKEILNNSR